MPEEIKKCMEDLRERFPKVPEDRLSFIEGYMTCLGDQAQERETASKENKEE